MPDTDAPRKHSEYISEQLRWIPSRERWKQMCRKEAIEDSDSGKNLTRWGMLDLTQLFIVNTSWRSPARSHNASIRTNVPHYPAGSNKPGNATTER